MSEKDTASFKIREATSADISALAALHVEAFNETHGIAPIQLIKFVKGYGKSVSRF